MNKDKKLEKVLAEYRKKFNENFLFFVGMELSAEEIIELAQKAIDTNTPYEPEIEDGVIY